MTQGPCKPVLLIRPGVSNTADAHALSQRNIPSVIDPYLRIAPATDEGARPRADRLVEAIRDHADWLAITSANAVTALTFLVGEATFSAALNHAVARGLRIAAVGDATARALHACARLTVHCPSPATAEQLTGFLQQDGRTCDVVLPQGDQALPTVAKTLQAAGWHVHASVVYITAVVDAVPESASDLAAGVFSAVVLRSPTAVRALHQYSPTLAAGTTLVCGGPTTAAEAARLFTAPLVTSRAPDAKAVAEAVEHAIWATTPPDRT